MKRLVSIALALFAASVATALADTYPSRPVTIVVPYPAGGPTDTLARILADHMRTSLGQTVIVENVAGGGGSVGVGRVARAAPDGYPVSIGHWNTHVVHGATLSLPFDVLNDFEPVSLSGRQPDLAGGEKDLAAERPEGIGCLAEAEPGKATAGTVGVGGASDVTGTYFKNVTGTTFQFVPFVAAIPLNQDLAAGHIDFTLGMAASTFPLVRSGQIKTYALMAKARWWAAPDVPTMDEAGVPGLCASFWHGLWLPKGAPNEIVARAQFGGAGRLGRSGGAAAICRSGPGSSTTRSAEPGGAARPSTGRDREVVADHQGGRHQGDVRPKAMHAGHRISHGSRMPRSRHRQVPRVGSSLAD